MSDDDSSSAAIGNHTWCIHSVNSVAAAAAAAATLRTDVTLLRESANHYLRRRRRRCSKNEDADADHVRISWIKSLEEEETSSSRKRKRVLQDDEESLMTDDTTDTNSSTSDIASSSFKGRHLYMEVWLQEEWSAAVVLCFYQTNDDASSFEFCLARGLKSSYECLMEWLALTQHFRHLIIGGNHSMLFGGVDLSHVVNAWATATTENDNNKKPLVLTFQPPMGVAAGLDTLSLTIPTQALLQLCQHLQNERSQQQQQQQQQEQQQSHDSTDNNVDITQSQSSSSSKAFESSRSEQDGASSTESSSHNVASAQNNNPDQDAAHKNSRNNDSSTATTTLALPIVRAMECYIQEAFGINIRPFGLIKIATAVGSLSRDGRFKPILVPAALNAIREIAAATRRRHQKHHHVVGGGPVAAAAAILPEKF